MQTIRIITAQNIEIEHEVAGIGERLVAAIFDWGIFVTILLLGIFLISVLRLEAITNAVWLIIYGALWVFYDLLCEIFMDGQSFGKKIMKIKVMSLNGNRPKVSQYLLRWMFRLIDSLMTGYLCGLITIIVSEKSQRLGDIVAGTVLIKTHPRTKIDHVAFMPVAADHEVTFPEAIQLTDKDVELIHEVIHNYMKTYNSMVVYNMAEKIRQHLHVEKAEGMNDMKFLQTLTLDYNYLAAQSESIL